MDSSQILTITVFVIVITIVGTIALAVVGYLAFRLRDRKHPSGSELDRSAGTPHFFERIRLPDTGDAAGAHDGDAVGLPDADPAGTAGETDRRPAEDVPAEERPGG